MKDKFTFTKEELKNEIWKDIKDFEGHYMVSNLGRIKSLKKGKELFLKIRKEENFSLLLMKNNYGYRRKLSKLVALNFLSKPKNFNVVSFRTDDYTDYRASNLVWIKRPNGFKNLIKKPPTQQSEQELKNLLNFYKLSEEQKIDIKNSKLSTSKLSLVYDISDELVDVLRNNE